jgi:2-polyprenyl-3-methyl-5-hydroxy-6-metoxy-1,4-benzoquinol methylase
MGVETEEKVEFSSHTRKVWQQVADLNIEDTFSLGPINAQAMIYNPKQLLFTLARYKFAAKMLTGCKRILDLGCGEGIGTFMLLRETGAEVTGVDFDASQIAYAQQEVQRRVPERVRFLCEDVVCKSIEGEKADGLVCLDVIEHVDKKEQGVFFEHVMATLEDRATAVFGTPNAWAHQHASARSKEGHINIFESERLKETLKAYFGKVVLFSMNDEVVHTGFVKMAHYLMALCVR